MGVAATIIHKNGLAMSFGRFAKLAIPYAAVQIALGTVYVLLVLRYACAGIACRPTDFTAAPRDRTPRRLLPSACLK